MKPIQVGLLGIGTVGSGTFSRCCSATRKRSAAAPAAASRSPWWPTSTPARACRRRRRGVTGGERRAPVIANPDIDIVVELIGGYGIAKALVLEAIAAGETRGHRQQGAAGGARHRDLRRRARKGRDGRLRRPRWPAASRSSKALREGLTANRIEWIAGIINGTTNFILSEMRDKGLDFDVVLKEAQRLGYAEADPTFDIGRGRRAQGHDHERDRLRHPGAVRQGHVEGITALQAADIRYAEQLGYRIKLLGITRRRRRQGIELRVHPTLVPAKAPDRQRRGRDERGGGAGDAVGTTLYYGKGAGQRATASAVIADLVDITRLHHRRPGPPRAAPGLPARRRWATPILPIDEVVTAFYLRLVVADQAGVLARITGILAENDISSTPCCSASRRGENQTDLIILTHDTVGAHEQGAGADAGAAHGAGADRAHPQGRAERS